MKTKSRTTALITATLVATATLLAIPATAQAADYADLVPLPQSVTTASGTTTLTSSSAIMYDTADISDVADALAEDILDSTGLALSPVLGTSPGAGDVYLSTAGSGAGGAYEFEANGTVTLESSDRFGLAAAGSTLLQLLGGATSLPNGSVTDSPDSEYRSVSIDLARGYWTLNDLENIIDLSRLYKLSYVHLHLTDDQNFMFPSTAYPLTSANNDAARPAYTVAELEALGEYALSRGIVLVPELDMPSHAAKMISAYPAVFVADTWNTIDFTSSTARDALKTLLSEVADVFPDSPYIHIGADETLAGGPDFSSFLNEMNSHIRSEGKTTILWEGFNAATAATVDKTIIIETWENIHYPAQAAIDDGFTVINGSWEPLYLIDGTHGAEVMRSVSDIYSWDTFTFGNRTKPFPVDATTVPNTSPVLGGELSSWGGNGGRGFDRLVDRMPALAAKLWNPAAETNFSGFTARAAAVDVVADSLINHSVTLGVHELVGERLGPQVGGGGAGTEVAVDSGGNPWTLSVTGDLWQWTGSVWTVVPTPGPGTDFAIGEDGTIAYITGGDIHMRSGGVWSNTGGQGISVAVESDGTIWAATETGSVWEYSASTWTPKASWVGATAVAASAAGGKIAAILNGIVHTFDGSTWTTLAAPAEEIAMDALGVWAVHEWGTVSVYSSSNWYVISSGRSTGGAFDIGAGGGRQYVLSY